MGRSSGHDEKLLDSMLIRKVKLIEFAHRLVICRLGQRGIIDYSVCP